MAGGVGTTTTNRQRREQSVTSPGGQVFQQALNPFAIGAPQGSSFQASPMRIDPSSIPQVSGQENQVTANQIGAQNVAAQNVRAEDQDWSQRNLQDYGALAATGNTAAAQRAHMAQVAAGMAGPSLAELQLRQGQETAAANAMGAALTGRGGAGSQIAAMRAGSAASMQANQQAALMRAQEQLAAEQQVGALIGQETAAAQARGQLTAGQQQGEQAWAAQSLQAALANQQAGLTAGQANQQAALTAAQANQGALLQAAQANQAAGLTAGQANQAAYLQGLDTAAGTYNAAMGANAAIAQANLGAQTERRGQNLELLGGAAQGAGGLMSMLSDERSKQDVRELQAENLTLRSALESAASGRGPELRAMRAARPVEYEYRPEAYGRMGPQPIVPRGERAVGVMAQDVPGLATRADDGRLGIDTGRLASAAAAGSSSALRRTDDIEARLRRLEARG